MAQQGARNLILLSRSGPVSNAAKMLVNELEKCGVTVRTPRCDVADAKSLASTITSCADMPPIKGCLQATMVLQVHFPGLIFMLGEQILLNFACRMLYLRL